MKYPTMKKNVHKYSGKLHVIHVILVMPSRDVRSEHV